MKKLFAVVLAVCMVISGVGITGMGHAQAKEKSSTVIDVTKFGADPSGKNDSTDAVKKALEKAKETQGSVTVNFPKGEYHFWKDYAAKRVYHTSNTSSLSYPEKSIAILLENVDNVTFEGNGSSLIMHGDMMALAAVESENVTFHDFVLDYQDPDTVDISVVGNGVDENGKEYADFYIPANYDYVISEDGKNITWQGETSPVTGKPYWEKQSADFCAYLVIYKGYDQTVARASDKAASNPFTNVSSIQKTGENVLRFTYDGQRPKDQEVGNIFLLSDSATRKTAGAFFWESENVLVDNIDVHYLSGFGWLTQMCKNVEFKGVDFLPRYGTGKYTTSNADQLHVAGCGGYFKVTDCNFSMSHDDPINIHGSYMRVEEVIDNRTLKVQYIHGQQGGFRQFHEGDEVLFYSRTYLEPPAGESEDEPYIVESSIAPGEEYNGEKLDMRTEIVTFKEEFSEETLNDLRIKVTRNNSSQKEGLYVAENVTYTPEVHISGNHMKSIPTRGILCTVRKPVIIENNTFDNMAMANIYLSNDANYWYESGPIRDMTIRNNKFYIRPTGQNEWGNVSGIFVDPVVLTGVQDAPPSKGDIPVHRNITIEGNEFHMANDNVVTANGVDGLKIVNNKILRDDAGLSLKLNAQNTIAVGEKQKVSTEVHETTLTKDIFKFTNCKNVEISGNTYDDGLNLNVTTSGDRMSEEDVEIADNELTLNQTGGNLITSASKVKYVTSDPSVAYVNEQQELVGVKEGEVTLLSYVEWNGTIVKSDEAKITVGEKQASEVVISADTTEFAEEGQSTSITYTEGAVLEVLDPVSGQPSNLGFVDGDSYTALKEGVVLVRAAKDGKSAGILMINSFEKSYGNTNHLYNDNVTIDNMYPENLYGTKDEIGIIAQTGSELYGGSTNVNNLVKFAIPKEYKEDLRIQVDVKGLPVTGEGYNNAGIILYKDGNNYYSVGKKGHMSGVTAVYEENASASERNGNAKDNQLTNTTFEIEIQDDTATVRYKDANGTWQMANTQNNIHAITDGDLYLALCAWKNSGRDFETMFGNVKIAKASETTSEDMGSASAKQIFAEFDNDRPVVEQLELTVNGVNEKAAAQAEAADGDGISSMVYQWTLEKEDGTKDVIYTSNSTYTPKETGVLQVAVTAMDIYGKPSRTMVSSKEEVAVNTSEDEELKNLYINGNKVQGFEKQDAVFIMPKGAANKIRVSYDMENAKVDTILKDEDGNILAELSDACETIIKLPETLIVERGSTSYKIKIRTQEEGTIEVQGLRVNEENVNLDAPIKEETGSYFKTLTTDDAKIEIKTNDSVSRITATRSFFQKEVKNESQEDGVFLANIDLTAGINAFDITLTGADNITQKSIRLYLFRDGYNESTLADLKVNGRSVDGFEPEKKEYTVYVEKEDAEVSIEAVQGAQEQTTSITKDNVRTEGLTAKYELGEGLNRIIVANKSENMWITSFYTLNIVVKSEDNADLLSLETDETMTPAFEALKPDVLDYDINMNKGTLHVQAKALMDDAKVVLFTDTQKAEGVGKAEADFTIYEGENKVQAEVTAPDGKTKKVYNIVISAEGLEYASDRMDLATKTEVGYGNLEIDRSPSGGAIALVNEDGERVEFAKGLGAHAQSNIIYNIEGQGYEIFEAYVGIDYYQVSQGNVPSSVTFRVLVDGVEKFNSQKEMTVADSMMKVEVDVKGASTIELIADQGANNYNDHADWADAKFIKPLAQRPQEPVELSTAVLEYALELAKDINTDGVITSVAEKYNAALANAKEVLEKAKTGNADVTQEMIDNAWQELILAMQYLSFKQGDKTDLGKVIELAEEMAANLDNYLNDGKDGFNQALADAKVVYKDGNAMQTEVDTSWRTLLSAMSGLQLKPDKSMLQELLKEAAELLQSDYEKESLAAFRSVFADAKAVYEDEQAKSEDVKAAEGALKDAMEKLTPASSVDEHTVANAKGSEEVTSADKNETQKDTGVQTVKSAKTSDATQAWVWLILMTGAALTALAIRKRKAK